MAQRRLLPKMLRGLRGGTCLVSKAVCLGTCDRGCRRRFLEPSLDHSRADGAEGVRHFGRLNMPFGDARADEVIECAATNTRSLQRYRLPTYSSICANRRNGAIVCGPAQPSRHIRLLTHRCNDWSSRFPLIVEAVKPPLRSCLIDGDFVSDVEAR